jgi:hypothetical protein
MECCQFASRVGLAEDDKLVLFKRSIPDVCLPLIVLFRQDLPAHERILDLFVSDHASKLAVNIQRSNQ